jgi:hypothetical protein
MNPGLTNRRLLIGILLLFPVSLYAESGKSRITPESRAQIIRTLGSEFIALKVPLPINKRGLTINSKGEFDWKKNEEAAMNAGQFIAPGITVQITTLTIADNKIIFEINGGGKKKRRYLEHIQIGAGGGSRPMAAPTAQAPPKGSYVIIKFDDAVPDLTPDQVREILSPVLDFSRKSATRSFIESVPEEFKEAAKNKQVVVGMDKDLVLAIMGRPLRKVRDKKGEVETEDWIYGERPQKVIFVTFLKGKVVSVKEY